MIASIDGKCALLLTSILLIWLLPRSRLGAIVGGSDALLSDGAPVDLRGQAGHDESMPHSSRRGQSHAAALQLDVARTDERANRDREASGGGPGGEQSEHLGDATYWQHRRSSTQRMQIDKSGGVKMEESRADTAAGQPGVPLHAEVTSRDVSLHLVAPAEPGSGVKSYEFQKPSQGPGDLSLFIPPLPWVRWPVRALAEFAVWKEAVPQLAQYWNATLGVISQAEPGGVPLLESLLLRILWCSLGFFVALLFLCATIDTARNWRHRTNLNRVQEKVRRANEVFLGLHDNVSLCPCCVELVPTPSDSATVFLCGHIFHMQCLNEWHKRHSSSGAGTPPGQCPVCEGPQSHLQAARSELSSCSASQEGASRGLLPDSTRLFSLQCLADEFPSITTKGCMKPSALQRLANLLMESSVSKAAGQKARLEMC